MNPEYIKKASEHRLRSLGVMVNEHLPTIESPSELRPRSAREVSARACALSHVIYVGFGISAKEMLWCITEANLIEDLTPRERAFLMQRKHSDLDKAWAAWHFAAVHACAWALGLVEMNPLGGCPDTVATHFPPKHGANPDATLRPFEEIYSEADLYYRLHWAARQARFDSRDFPIRELEIQLRRQALDWIVGLPYEWDDVPGDT